MLYALCSMQCAWYTMHYVMHTKHYAYAHVVCIIHYTSCSMQYAWYTIQYAMHTMHDTQCNMHYAAMRWGSMQCILCIMHTAVCILCIMHNAHCTLHYAAIRRGSMQGILCIMHTAVCSCATMRRGSMQCILCTAYYVQYAYYALCIMHTAHCTLHYAAMRRAGWEAGIPTYRGTGQP